MNAEYQQVNKAVLLQIISGSAQKNQRTMYAGFLCWHYLSSRAVARQVLSARVSLTSVFGMGTGGPSYQSAPTIYVNDRRPSKTTLFARKRNGDPYRIRTDVKGVRGLCLNHLTNGPCALYIKHKVFIYWSAFRDSNPGPTD